MVELYGISKEQQQRAVAKRVAALHGRLEKGDQYCIANPEDKDAEALYLDILKQYEKAYFEWVTLGGNESEGYLQFR